jgi:hypothetical protein
MTFVSSHSYPVGEAASFPVLTKGGYPPLRRGSPLASSFPYRSIMRMSLSLGFTAETARRPMFFPLTV